MSNDNLGFELLLALGIDTNESVENINRAISKLKGIDPIRVDFDLAQGNSSASIEKLEARIKELTSEVKKLESELKGVGTSLSSEVSKGLTQVEQSAKRATQAINKMGTGNSLEGLSKDAIKSFRNLQELYEYFEDKQIRIRTSKNDLDQVTKVVTQIKNEFGQLENVTIRPKYIEGTDQVKGFGVTSVVDDAATFKLNDSIDKVTERLRTLQAQGTITGDVLQRELNNLSLAKTNEEVEAVARNINRIATESTSMVRFNEIVGNAERLIARLAETSREGADRVDEMREALAKVTPGNLNEARQALTQIKDVAEDIKLNETLKQQIADTTFSISRLGSDLEKTKNLFSSTIDIQEYQRLQKVIDELKLVDPQTIGEAKQLNNTVKEVREQVRQLNAEATTASRNSMGFLNSFKTAMEKFPVWMAASTVFYGITAGVQDLIDKVIELDTAMTDLRRVADGEEFEFNSVIERSIELSDQLSGKVSDVMNLVTEFARTGKTIDESFALAETTQALTNISDLNADQSVDSLTAAMIAFNIEAEDSIRIADSLNEVDNNFSITTLDLSQSLNKAASTAATFGKVMPT